MGGHVITIGNFDGVHIGHRQLMLRASKLAAKYDAESLVMTFRPHPGSTHLPLREFILTTDTEKVDLLQSLGMNKIRLLNFDAIKDMDASAFIDRIVLPYEPRAVVVGKNFRLGKDRGGDTDFLRQILALHDCELIEMDEITDERGVRVSSSRIRSLLKSGKVRQASELLAAPYTISGRVVHGQHLARDLGFPTANITGIQKLLPKTGVYVSRTVCGGDIYPSVTAITLRTTISPALNEPVVESHILSPNGFELYGSVIAVEFLDFIRDEEKFHSLEELRLAIAQDARIASERAELYSKTQQQTVSQ